MRSRGELTADWRIPDHSQCTSVALMRSSLAGRNPPYSEGARLEIAMDRDQPSSSILFKGLQAIRDSVAWAFAGRARNRPPTIRFQAEEDVLNTPLAMAAGLLLPPCLSILRILLSAGPRSGNFGFRLVGAVALRYANRRKRSAWRSERPDTKRTASAVAIAKSELSLIHI